MVACCAGVTLASGLGVLSIAFSDTQFGTPRVTWIQPEADAPAAVATADLPVLDGASLSVAAGQSSLPAGDLSATRLLNTRLSLGARALAADPQLALSLIPDDAVPSIGVGYQAAAASGGAAAADGAGFTRRFYLGIGAGVSHLEPRSYSDALTVGDKTDTGVHVYAGYDLTRWLSAEIYFAELGSAGIDFLGDPVGDVDYQVYGLNAIAYLFNSRSGLFTARDESEGLWRREGLSLYLSAGAGGLNNDSNIPYDKDYDAHVSFGAGLEYGFSNGVALRADISSYDSDVQYASVSVLKRFGHVPAAPVARTAPPPTPTPVAPVEPQPEPQAPTGPALLATGLFAFDKSLLNVDARARLDALIAQERDTDSLLVIDGHADSVGTDEYNQALSERRAAAVYQYLLDAGIDASRMTTRGYGEQQPVSSNATVQGRALNRRAEVIRQ